MAPGPLTSWHIEGEKVKTVTDFIFLGSNITADGDCSHEIKRCLLLGRKAMTNLDCILKSRDITLPTKVCIVKLWSFQKSCKDVRIDHKEAWAPKNWCFPIVVLENTLDSPSDCKEIQAVNPKGNHPWIFIGRTDAGRASTLATWCKEPTHWKRPWCWERLKAKGKGVTEDEMVRQYHQLNGHEYERTLGNSEGQRNLKHYSPWGHKESDSTSEWTTTE